MTTLLTRRRLWVLLTLAGTFLGPASTPLGLTDVWSTLRGGAWMAANRRLLVTDPFTSAPPASPQINAQWLAQLAYYGLHRLGGFELVIAGTAIAVSAAYALLLGACWAATGRLRVACGAVALGYLLGLTNLSARPQTLAYPLFGLFALAVARAEWRRDTRLLWLLPPATAAWANLHGSFPLGLLLLGCALAGSALARRPARPYLLALAGCAAAACLTPYGPGSLAYVSAIGTNPAIRELVVEWAPTSIASPEGKLFFVSLAVVAALALRSPARLTPTEWLTLAAFGWLGISAVRAVAWWGMAMAPIAARLLAPLLPSPGPSVSRERPAANAAIAAAIVGLVASSLPWLKTANPLLPADKRALLVEETPVAVARFLEDRDFPGRMFNHQGWGSYLDWALWPRHQPFVDGRIEIHPTQVWLDYLTIVYPGVGWRALLDSYGIGYLVLSRGHEAALIAALEREGGWRRVYQDAQASVFVRAAS